MDLLTTIILLITIILLVVQAIMIYKEKRKYNEWLGQFNNMKRALTIAQNKLLDSERERTWLNNQIAIIFEELAQGKFPEHPKLKPSWQYNEDLITDPRD